MLPISVVIPTYGRADLLARFMPTYITQSCAEIIIVDDHSPNSVEMSLATVFEGRSRSTPDIIFVRNEKRMQQPISRMIGVSHSTQPFIFFGEDDAYLSKDYIANLYGYIENRVADIVASSWIRVNYLPEDVPENQWFKEAEEKKQLVDLKSIHFYGKYRVGRPINVPWLHTLSLIPRYVIQEIEFDPYYKGNAYREETDFYVSAGKKGYSMAFVPGPPAYHYKGCLNKGGGQFRHGILWYEYWSLRNNLYFLKKHKSYLEQLGRDTMPLRDTFLLLLKHLMGYPGRFAQYLRRSLRF